MTKLYVGNLNYSTTSDQLQELFAPFGEIKNINIIEGKGFAFVEMATDEEAAAAKEKLNNANFGGRTLRVDEAHPQKPRENRGGFRDSSHRGGGDRGGNRRY